MTTEHRPDDSEQKLEKLENLEAAVNHLHESIESQSIAVGAAKGILYSLIETLGALIGDPDLPEHARSGYEALRDKARELRGGLEKH
ncbi:hypothetical protein [Burkholderia sp.]|uniref:hypothetical protein n=1 Tax=Burkholderia sp. TaxID=36773 RepID=UPI0025BAE174|nr:hypothetical protein [Burkholderia sp.]MBS6362845.1 hypothetical protein [Burkholderia sp.]